jgi:hypothetical protein
VFAERILTLKRVQKNMKLKVGGIREEIFFDHMTRKTTFDGRKFCEVLMNCVENGQVSA